MGTFWASWAALRCSSSRRISASSRTSKGISAGRHRPPGFGHLLRSCRPPLPPAAAAEWLPQQRRPERRAAARESGIGYPARRQSPARIVSGVCGLLDLADGRRGGRRGLPWPVAVPEGCCSAGWLERPPPNRALRNPPPDEEELPLATSPLPRACPPAGMAAAHRMRRPPALITRQGPRRRKPRAWMAPSAEDRQKPAGASMRRASAARCRNRACTKGEPERG